MSQQISELQAKIDEQTEYVAQVEQANIAQEAQLQEAFLDREELLAIIKAHEGKIDEKSEEIGGLKAQLAVKLDGLFSDQAPEERTLSLPAVMVPESYPEKPHRPAPHSTPAPPPPKNLRKPPPLTPELLSRKTESQALKIADLERQISSLKKENLAQSEEILAIQKSAENDDIAAENQISELVARISEIEAENAVFKAEFQNTALAHAEDVEKREKANAEALSSLKAAEQDLQVSQAKFENLESDLVEQKKMFKNMEEDFEEQRKELE